MLKFYVVQVGAKLHALFVSKKIANAIDNFIKAVHSFFEYQK